MAFRRRGTLTSGVPEEPLPATTTFVFIVGAIIVIGWFLMFALLRSRW